MLVGVFIQCKCIFDLVYCILRIMEGFLIILTYFLAIDRATIEVSDQTAQVHSLI